MNQAQREAELRTLLAAVDIVITLPLASLSRTLDEHVRALADEVAHGDLETLREDLKAALNPSFATPSEPILETPPAAPEWVPSFFRHVIAGDRLRIGQDRAEVVSCSVSEWHADNTNKYEPRRWDHTEVHVSLRINDDPASVSLQFPPDTPVEILADRERKAQLILQQSFPGTKEVKP